MNTRFQPVLLFVALVMCPTLLGAAEERKPIEAVTFFRGTAADGTERIGEPSGLLNAKVTSIQPHFDALPPDEWWHGLVAVYGVQRNNRFELRRQAPAGEENLLEPLFFALPRTDERDAPNLAGTWRCTATRSGGSDAWFVWHLTLENESIAGRFDPSSEYRVASLTGGRFRTNRIEMTIEYSNETYQLTGELRDGRLVGQWDKGDREERGRWEGTRASLPPNRLPSGNVVPLFEWRRTSDDARRYVAGTNSPGQGWSRSVQPICRVWTSKQSNANSE
jgi:hypothetical protein